MKSIRIAFSLLILGGMLAGFSPRALCETPPLHFLYFKNGTSMRCDSLWKGPGDYVWCGKLQGTQGYPDDEVDKIRTFQVQPAVNELIDKSLDEFQKRNWDQVISVTSAAISMDPTNEVAYTNRAGAYAYKGLYEEAIKDCNKAIQLNPYFGLAFNNRGYALERTGRFDEALSEYEMSCRLRSSLGCSNYERLRLRLELTRP